MTGAPLRSLLASPWAIALLAPLGVSASCSSGGDPDGAAPSSAEETGIYDVASPRGTTGLTPEDRSALDNSIPPQAGEDRAGSSQENGLPRVDGSSVGDAFPSRAPTPVAAETRVTRLSHPQYRNSVQQLLGDPANLELIFAPDALNGFRFETSNALRVDSRLGPQYRDVAERLAADTVADPTRMAAVVACDPNSAECTREFLQRFGEQAFRRPLQEEELTAFLSLFDQAGELLQTGDAFADGVRLSLEAFLQSPQFLYRTEESVERLQGQRFALNDWEVASRLSFLLYDSMPDEPLFELARAGELHEPEQVRAAVSRMLASPRALSKLVEFHAQSWDFGRLSRISPDRATFANIPENLVSRVRRASTLFVRDVLANGGGLEELLLSPFAYVDDGLAPLYGLPTVGEDTPRRVEFNEAERLGLTMQVGFLAANAYSATTDPIHRGLFVVRDLLCRQIPAPPPNASTTPLPETDEPLDTTRQKISVLTGQGSCPTCHRQINPPGFAFEGFDALGQRRTTEEGFDVDTASMMRLDGRIVQFDGPQQLLGLVARSEEAHRCYSRRFIEFAFGRPLSNSDLPLLDSLSSRSLPLADLVTSVVTSPQFGSIGRLDAETL